MAWNRYYQCELQYLNTLSIPKGSRELNRNLSMCMYLCVHSLHDTVWTPECTCPSALWGILSRVPCCKMVCDVCIVHPTVSFIYLRRKAPVHWYLPEVPATWGLLTHYRSASGWHEPWAVTTASPDSTQARNWSRRDVSYSPNYEGQLPPPRVYFSQVFTVIPTTVWIIVTL